MIRTSVYFRPDSRAADLVRVGTLFLSRTSDHKMTYLSVKPDEETIDMAIAQTDSEAMRIVLRTLSDVSVRAMSTLSASFPTLATEADVVEALFRLLPPNLKHDEVEDYPAEDFFVRAVLELEEKRAGAVVVAPEPLPA
jgi:hypothetical protein